MSEVKQPRSTTMPWNADEFLYFNGHPLIYFVEKYMEKNIFHVLFPGGKCRECEELISEGNFIVMPKRIRLKSFQ